MTTKTQQIRIEAYDYPLPDERIAKFPLPQRDESKLLLYRGGEISETVFKHLGGHLPADSLLVFNNTRVIQARLLFQKETGARIEIFCLEPAEPRDYAQAFQQTHTCTWHCLVGNLKKWKEGVLSKTIELNGRQVRLQAAKASLGGGEMQGVTFSWDAPELTFAELLERAGVLPIPPYLHRETEASDLQTYQTVYSKVKGSVAAPTAGLHFTPELLDALDRQGIGREELTLHVGAGTFKPVQRDTLEEHEMHTEFISIKRSAIERLQRHQGPLIAVGTTSVRSLESLYHIGLILACRPQVRAEELIVGQWMPYETGLKHLPAAEALQHVIDYLDRRGQDKLITSTQILIAPGYTFRLTGGIITNFHQARSTLLLLISAFVGGDWERIYSYALTHDFRFLSYGDSSLLLPPDPLKGGVGIRH
jgi:S-adenosylmethionine:tRNA ribosyltransferase-isomerase